MSAVLLKDGHLIEIPTRNGSGEVSPFLRGYARLRATDAAGNQRFHTLAKTRQGVAVIRHPERAISLEVKIMSSRGEQARWKFAGAFRSHYAAVSGGALWRSPWMASNGRF